MTGVEESLKEGQRATGIAAVLTFLLALGKAIIGIMSGSIALLSDAVHSGADLIVLIVSWIGLKVSGRKPDKRFKYGYYKAESLAMLLVSVIILFAAYELFKGGYSRLFIISELSIPTIALAAALISAGVSLLVARYLSRTGKKINSQLLVTTSKERYMDSVSSIVVFAAILASYYRIPYAEGLVTILISILILRIGIIGLRDSVFVLMDISPSKEKEIKIKRIIRNVKEIENFSDLRLRKSGPLVFGEVNIKVKEFINIDRAHEIAEKLEEKVKAQFDEISLFTIHIEPYKTTNHKVAIPVIKPEGLKSKVMNNFGRTNHFVFVDTEKRSVKKVYSKNNPSKRKDVKAGLSAVHFIKDEGADILLTKEIGEIAFHTVRDRFIDVYESEGVTVKEVVDNFLNNRLSRFEKPTKKVV